MTVFFRGASPGVTLAADIDGPWNGPAVALLHGGGQTRHAWKGTERVLAANGFLALTVDLRGHGESGWDLDGDYSIDAFAADVRLLAAEIGRPLALVGASLGGLAALVALGEPPGLDSDLFQWLLTEPLRVDPADGCIPVPQRPGLGVEINEELLREAR